MIFHGFGKSASALNTSRKDTETPLLPSERASTIMIIEIENLSFDGLGPEISLVKGGSATRTGGWGHGQSGAPW